MDLFRRYFNWVSILSWLIDGFVVLVAYLLAVAIGVPQKVIPIVLGMIFMVFTVFFVVPFWARMLDNKG